MKPSERIKEIHNHLNSMKSDTFCSKMMEQYGTCNFKVLAIMRYLDEEYETSNKSVGE
jgi:hypothetical protein